MNELANFHFLRPEFLWLLVPLVILLGLTLRRSNSGDWQSQVDNELLPYLLDGAADSPRYGKLGLLFLTGVLAISALAGPAWRELPQPLFRNQSGIVLALDLSRSMDATDLKPNRVGRARFKISDIIAAWPDGQIGLLVYAADAFTVTPLTDDRSTLSLQLPALATNLMPAQGSNPEAAITLAHQLLRQAGLVKGEIWLLTDGLPANADIDTLTKAAGDYPVSVLGIGTLEGAPIATESGFLKDQSGNIRLPKLKETPLRQLAAASGGRYARLSADNGDIERLLGGVNLLDEALGDEQEDRRADLWQEEGPWLLLPLLLLAALAFRRGYLVVLLAIMVTPPPATAVSLPKNWQELWQTPNQRGQQAFDRGDNAVAIESFTDPAWQAAARYRQGDFEGAASALAEQTDVASLYNRGNAKAQLGDYPGALSDYEQVLQRQPDHEDARYNHDLVKQALEKQQQSSDQSEPSEEQNSDGEGESSDSENSASADDQEGKDDSADPSGESPQQPTEKPPQNPRNDENQDTDNRSDSEPEQESAAKQQNQQQHEQPEQADETDSSASTNLQPPMDEEARQAAEQWLRRIPDDPGGLLRRKFQYQYQRRGPANNQGEEW